jgi:signal transduction histidine kinase
LPIVQRVLELHGGRLDFHSEEGRGTTFEVWLPTDVPAGAADATERQGAA